MNTLMGGGGDYLADVTSYWHLSVFSRRFCGKSRL